MHSDLTQARQLPIRDVSFIVIARNEQFAIEKSLRALVSMPLEDCEIECVDSESDDGTLDVMQAYSRQYPFVRMLRCSGYLNASVARNAGIGEARRNIVCFCDGDCEFQIAFIRAALQRIEQGQADAVTGSIVDLVYSDDYSTLLNRPRSRVRYKRAAEIPHCGGNFMVRRKLIKKVGLWNEAFTINEDVEYTLRLSAVGRLVAIPELMALHHTRTYTERTFLYIKRGYPMYFGTLVRKNWHRPVAVSKVLWTNRGFIVGLFGYGVCISGILAHVWVDMPLAYVGAAVTTAVLVDIVHGLKRQQRILNRLMMHYLYPLVSMAGLLRRPEAVAMPTKVERVIPG